LPAKAGFDVLSGIAGASAGMLVLGRELDDARFMQIAAELGERLLRTAVRGPVGASWGPHGDGGPHLTGFAHGSAGASWCLGELYVAFGEPRFLETALDAVEYENHWYRDAESNWADLREHEPGETLNFGVGWCTGAPGTGLSRLYLLRHVRDGRLERDARRAVSWGKGALRSLRPARGYDYSLCHGRLGICELLTTASQVIGDAEGQELARETVIGGITRYGGQPETWPCGTVRGLNPSLMLGIAGIGHGLLRMAIPDVPSVLMLGR
jgi:lantibiotic modifying enzyme